MPEVTISEPQINQELISLKIFCYMFPRSFLFIADLNTDQFAKNYLPILGQYYGQTKVSRLSCTVS